MQILVTNDDGVNSSGIVAAKNAVRKLGDIYVVAPATQQSGIGHALTLFEPIRVSSSKLLDGSHAYSVSGTPTDAVILGIYEIIKEKPDLVISGINIGENLGMAELSTSGTIGAAMEAAVHGVPSLAISMQVTRDDIKFHEGHLDMDFAYAMEITRKLSEKIIKKGLPEGIAFLNVNIPSYPKSNKIKLTRLGKKMYSIHIQKRFDPRGREYYWIDGDPIGTDEEGTDVYTLRSCSCPTITPISLDSTSDIELMKNWLG